MLREAGKGTFDARYWATHWGVTVRRLQQLRKEHRETGVVPTLKKHRRPKAPPLTAAERAAIDRAWEANRVGSRLLFRELKRRGISLPHGKVRARLLATGRTVPSPRKQRRRSWVRYEREHSGSLLHGDWHQTSEAHPHVLVWLDDASRCVLAGVEVPDTPTAAQTIACFREAQAAAAAWNLVIRDVNTDRGTQFYQTGGTSQFETYLASQGIRFVPSRTGHPQTNGKCERFWLEYDRHRWRFDSLEAFLAWYNGRLHGALWIEVAENPNEAFVRKLPPEVLVGLFERLAEGVA